MKKLIKRAAAAALSLALIGGAMPFEAGTFDLSKISLTAEAASGKVSFNSSTGVLTLSGDLSDKNADIKNYRDRDTIISAVSTSVPRY
ncbi:MAG: hypothetical protein IJ071_05445 [Ruminococcus sp.]|nr:hypothetical protein [Ruminococcus sp.]